MSNGDKMHEIDWSGLLVSHNRAEEAFKVALAGTEQKVKQEAYNAFVGRDVFVCPECQNNTLSIILSSELSCPQCKASFPSEDGLPVIAVPGIVEKNALVFSILIGFLTRRLGRVTLAPDDLIFAQEILTVLSPAISSPYKTIIERIMENPDQNKLNIPVALSKRYLSFHNNLRVSSEAQKLMSRLIEELMLYSITEAYHKAYSYSKRRIYPEHFKEIFSDISEDQLIEVINYSNKLDGGD